MNIEFVGDICTEKPCVVIDHRGMSRQKGICIANLEGPILERTVHGNGVYNTPEVLDVLKDRGIRAVSLANNHMFDYGTTGFENTLKELDGSKILYFGAGKNSNVAAQPVELVHKDERCYLFGFGWSLIGCQKAGPGCKGVNVLTAQKTLQAIDEFRKKDSTSTVIYMMHWNYELEEYPQPAHRKLAMELIDRGVDAIIGNHSHVVQGAETYMGKPIVYGLGNWMFPPRKIGKFQLKYPEKTYRQIIVSITFNNRKTRSIEFEWYNYLPGKNTIQYSCTENIEGVQIRRLSTFRGMNSNEYGEWFRNNRVQNKLLPVFYDYNDTIGNRFKELWVKIRQLIITMLVMLKIKGSLS